MQSSSECSISGSEGAPCCTLLSTSRFLMHPLKCLNCSCGYSYDMFSLTPPSCRTWLPFRYLKAESNSKYTKKASQWMNRTLTPGSTKGKKKQWQVAFCHFRTWICLQASSGYMKIFPQQRAKQMSAVIVRDSYTVGMIHGHCFSLKISFSNEELFARNS